MSFKKYHPVLDTLTLALAAMQEGDADEAQELMEDLMDDQEALDAAMEDIGDNNQDALDEDECDSGDDMDEDDMNLEELSTVRGRRRAARRATRASDDMDEDESEEDADDLLDGLADDESDDVEVARTRRTARRGQATASVRKAKVTASRVVARVARNLRSI